VNHSIYQHPRFVLLTKLTFIVSLLFLLQDNALHAIETSINYQKTPHYHSLLELHNDFNLSAISTSWQSLLAQLLLIVMGLLVFILAFWALIRKRVSASQPLLVPWLLVLTNVIYIAINKNLLLISTSTTLLVNSLCRLAILGQLWWLILSTQRRTLPPTRPLRALRIFVLIALIFFVCDHSLQIIHNRNLLHHNYLYIYFYIKLTTLLFISILALYILTIKKYRLYWLNATFLLIGVVFFSFSILTMPGNLSHIFFNYLAGVSLLISLLSLLYKLFAKNWETIL